MDKFTLNLPEENNLKGTVNAGALTGSIVGGSLSNVTAGFESENAKALAELNADEGHHIGSVAGQSSGSIQKSGVTAGLNAAEGLDAVAQDDAGLALSDSFEDSFDAANEGVQNQYAASEDRSSGHLKIFMQPFFVENFEYTYDGTSHNYSDLNKVTVSGGADGESPEEITIFELEDLFAFNDENDPDVDVKDAGTYEYELTNNKGFDGFYLVQPEQVTLPEGQTSTDNGRYTIDGRTETSTGHGYIKINKRKLGTIEVGDVTITEGDSFGNENIELTSDKPLNFAPNEKLDDFEMKIVSENDPNKPGEQEIDVDFEGLGKNYEYDVIEGTLTVEEKEEPTEPGGDGGEEGKDPAPEPNPDEGDDDKDPDVPPVEPDPEPLPEPDTPVFPDLPSVPDNEHEENTALLAMSAADTEVTKCTYCQGSETKKPEFAGGLGLVHGNQGRLIGFAGSYTLVGQLLGDLLLASGSDEEEQPSSEAKTEKTAKVATDKPAAAS